MTRTNARSSIKSVGSALRDKVPAIALFQGLLASFGAADFGGFGSPIPYPVLDDGQAVTVAFVSSDAIPDVVVCNYNGNVVSLFLGTGAGTLQTPPQNLPVGGGPRGAVCVDLNGDMLPDIAVANQNSDNFSVLINNGVGGFLPAANYSSGDGPAGIAAGDVDGDADLDIIVAASADGSACFHVNNGSGVFSPPTALASGAGAISVVLATLDSDPHLDLAVANSGAGNVSVFLNNGVGAFSAPTNYPTGSLPWRVRATRINADTTLDLAVVHEGSDTLLALFNNGGGTFSPATPVSTGSASDPRDVVAVDLDLDGDTDFVSANFVGDSVSVLINDGTGLLSPPTLPTSFSYPAGDGAMGVDSGDFNGDGVPDLVVSNLHDNNVVLLLNVSTAKVTEWELFE